MIVPGHIVKKKIWILDMGAKAKVFSSRPYFSNGTEQVIVGKLTEQLIKGTMLSREALSSRLFGEDCDWH